MRKRKRYKNPKTYDGLAELDRTLNNVTTVVTRIIGGALGKSTSETTRHY